MEVGISPSLSAFGPETPTRAPCFFLGQAQPAATLLSSLLSLTRGARLSASPLSSRNRLLPSLSLQSNCRPHAAPPAPTLPFPLPPCLAFWTRPSQSRCSHSSFRSSPPQFPCASAESRRRSAAAIHRAPTGQTEPPLTQFFALVSSPPLPLSPGPIPEHFGAS
jgi:hypothetical protein